MSEDREKIAAEKLSPYERVLGVLAWYYTDNSDAKPISKTIIEKIAGVKISDMTTEEVDSLYKLNGRINRSGPAVFQIADKEKVSEIRAKYDLSYVPDAVKNYLSGLSEELTSRK